MRKYVILFNGPPGSGKDTLAQEFIKKCSTEPDFRGKKAVICKFADPIRAAVFATFPHITPQNFEESKTKPIYANSNVTLRQWIMKYAEEFMKPLFGKRIFANITCDKIAALSRENDFVLVTDLGFLEEITAVMESTKLNDVEILLVRLLRDGTSFVGDTRNYITDTEIDDLEHTRNFVQTRIKNNESIAKAVSAIMDVIAEADELAFYNEIARA